jgi:hypothetical protein
MHSYRFLRRDMTVRQVAHDFPATRAVFVRYGEPAERAPFGHLEPLDRFAVRSRVPLDQLLDELSRVTGMPVDRRGPEADYMHRPFLAAGLLITLTMGAGWGAWLLWQIGLHADFQAASISHVVAHGDAQLWGLIALFIAGISLRWLPTATATRPVSGLVAAGVWFGMVSGIGGGFVWAVSPAAVPWLGIASGVALLIAAGTIASFFGREVVVRLPQPWACAILAAGCWWVVWAAFTLWLRYHFCAAGPGDYALTQRSWNIELAVFGLGTNAVYGFGLRLLPGIVGGAVQQGWATLAIALHNVGLMLLPLGHFTAQAPLQLAATLCMAAGAILLPTAIPGLRQRKQFSKRPEQGAPGLAWYVQLAIMWLVAAVLLMLVGQVYSVSAGRPVPQAWRGATRHALTVGFLTTLIMGVAQRLLPILGHTLLAWPRLVVPTFLLIGIGSVLRVTTELATLAFPLA